MSVSGTGRTRRRPPLLAYALGLAASGALGFAIESCAVSASGDCTEKADCPPAASDDGATPTNGTDASLLDAGEVDGLVVDATSLDSSAPDAADAVTEETGVVDVADGSVIDAVAKDSPVVDGAPTSDGEGGDVVLVADAAAEAGNDASLEAGNDGAADAGDASVADAAREAASPLCGGVQCPAACAAASEILAITALPGNSGSFNTTDTVCVFFHGSVSGWGVSNGDGRTVTSMGATTFGPASATTLNTPPAIAAGADGSVYWIFTAGTVSFASMFIF
jgi:hypothetical protein